MPIARIEKVYLPDSTYRYNVQLHDGGVHVCTLHATTEGVAYDLANRINTSIERIVGAPRRDAGRLRGDHPFVVSGFCGFCGHYGDDCTGLEGTCAADPRHFPSQRRFDR